ncbi:MAG: phosphoribosylformylglycinamidine cyclo-ligase [Bdellovibrionales bacterium]|nr:phosphoribosylformylglycinamidine cyclo-ligase [Bdellovibrionales bacterium]
MDYKSAGVNIDTAEELVSWLQENQDDATHKELRVEGIGGFASLFRLPSGMKNPCIVSCTDGVGTKLKLAFEFKDYESVGVDLVAMCVNDMATVGAQPLFFLDYFSIGKLELDIAKPFLAGVMKACRESHCLLIGGETAEMPGFYPKGEFDCAGFAVGVVDGSEAWGKNRVKEGDRLYGIRSSGFHSNGYSLIRKIFEKDIGEHIDVLKRPTRLYVKPVLDLLKDRVEIHAAAHITGGGFDNVGRVIPKGLGWKVPKFEFPEIYREVKSRTGLDDRKILKTFNCGFGFILIAPEDSRQSIEKAFGEIHDFGLIAKSASEERLDWGNW